MDAIRDHFSELSEACWVFRGQADSRWRLVTSLERSVPMRGALRNIDVEKTLIAKFKRRAHLFSPDMPALEDDLAWVALMQHHGAPTRLLDFTSSPYVALYFAIEQVQSDKSCAVWAINSKGCDQRAVERLEVLQRWGGEPLVTREEFDRSDVAQLLTYPRLFRKVFLENRFTLVCTVQPQRDNLRMGLQQGVFLCPGSLELHSFGENLLAQLITGKDPDYFLPVWNPPQIYRFLIKGSIRNELLSELKRMNISRASLFPDLDGFAQSLRYDLGT